MNTSPTKWLSLNFRKQQSTRANTSTDYCLFTNVCALRQQALKKVLIFLLITPFIQSDLANNEKYAGKMQSPLRTGELFLTHFIKSYTDSGITMSKTQHRKKWGCPVKMKTSYFTY